MDFTSFFFTPPHGLDRTNQKPPPPFVAEITVLSAEGLNAKPSSLFSLRRRLRPFITLSAAPSLVEYKTSVAVAEADDEGRRFGSNPTWGEAFRIPLDAGFFSGGCFVFLRLFTERMIFGPALVGWCRIPASDMGQPPVGSVRRLSYRLRKRDGSRSSRAMIVNLAVKVESLQPVVVVAGPAEEPCRTVIGVPVPVFRGSR